MADLPSGTITFLFTDVEGSTALWERDRQAMVVALGHHLARPHAGIRALDGIHAEIEGDAVPAACPTPLHGFAAGR
jgi:class 3 adenylate cyclase